MRKYSWTFYVICYINFIALRKIIIIKKVWMTNFNAYFRTKTWRLNMQYIYYILLKISNIKANSLVLDVFTLLIYRLPYFEGSCSVNFLRVKAIANFIFVQSRILEVIHAWTFEPNATFEIIFWSSKPFIITIANISGTVSTW